MIDYVQGMLDDFPDKKLGPKDVSQTPAAENLFAAGNGPKLSKEKAQEFHTYVAKALFACKRARPDIGAVTIAMTTRVQKPNDDDWGKLVRMMRYLIGTKDDKLILSADDVHVIKWYVDASLLCILTLGATLAVLWRMGGVCLYPSPTSRSSI